MMKAQEINRGEKVRQEAAGEKPPEIRRRELQYEKKKVCVTVGSSYGSHHCGRMRRRLRHIQNAGDYSSRSGQHSVR